MRQRTNAAARWALACLAILAITPSSALAYVYSGVKLTQVGTSPVTVTYSYSNLLDGGLDVPAWKLRAAVEEGLGVWARYAPLRFVEVPDAGPMPQQGDPQYSATGMPRIRIGHHYIDGAVSPNAIAHAYFPLSSGLGADVHFDDANSWSVGPDPTRQLDILYTFVHEMGHVLGLSHEAAPPSGNLAIMNAIYPLGHEVYSGLGTAFLYPDDIAGVQSVYGAGLGSVTPLPEPASMTLMLAGVSVLLKRRRAA